MKTHIIFIRCCVAIMIVSGLIQIYYNGANSLVLLIGLFTLFATSDMKPDERAIAIKSSSAYMALIISYAIVLVTANLYSHNLISFQLKEINHFLIMLFTMAIIIYHSWMYFTSK